MPTDEERLLIRIEASQRKFEKQMEAIYRSADRRSNAMEKTFRRSNERISRGFRDISTAANRSFNRIAGAAAAAAAAIGTREVSRYADAWTEVENKIRSAEQISGTQARTTSQLNDLANETRSGLGETAELYSRLLRLSGQLAIEEEQVAKATEITAKAFKAGGAAASEQAAGILQLSQGLSSGLLQGDELRSVRENAPLIAAAIAQEFKTTVGGLKELGAEGELTSDRIVKAILNAEKQISGAFDATTATISDGFKVFRNGLTEFVGGFDDGARASENMVGNLSRLGEYLSENSGRAERFGRQVREAFTIMGEAVSSFRGRFPGLGEDFAEVGKAARDMQVFVLGVIQEVVANAAGAAAFMANAVLRAVHGVETVAVGIANAAVSSVETILNGVLAGINKVVDGLNAVIEGANKLPKVAIPTINTGSLSVSLPRGETSTAPPDSGLLDSFRGTRDNVRELFDVFNNRVSDSFQRIKDAADKADEEASKPPPSGAGGFDFGGTPGDGGSSGGGSKAAKKNRSELQEFLGFIEEEKIALREQASLTNKSAGEIAKLEAKYRLLSEARRLGLSLDKEVAASGRTVRDEINAQADAIGRMTIEAEKYAERAEYLKAANEQIQDGFIDSIVAGNNFADTLQDVAQSLAKAALQAAFFNRGPLAGGGEGGGLLGGIFGKLFGAAGATAGARAGGGPVRGGSAYLVNERTPNSELFVPSRSGAVLSVSQAQAALRGGSQSGGTTVLVEDHSGTARTERSKGPNGRDLVRVIVAEELAKGGFDKGMKGRYGASPIKVQR